MHAHPSAWDAFLPRYGFFLTSKSSQWSLLCLILCFRCLLLHNKPPYKFTLLSQWLKQQLFVKTILQVEWRLLHCPSPFPESDCIQLAKSCIQLCWYVLGLFCIASFYLMVHLLEPLHVTLSSEEGSLLPSRSTPRGQAPRWPAYQASVYITFANVPLVKACPWPSPESMWKEITLRVKHLEVSFIGGYQPVYPTLPSEPKWFTSLPLTIPQDPSKSHPRKTSSLALRSGSYHLDAVQVWLRCVGTIP